MMVSPSDDTQALEEDPDQEGRIKGINDFLYETEMCWKDPFVVACGADCGDSCPFDEED